MTDETKPTCPVCGATQVDVWSGNFAPHGGEHTPNQAPYPCPSTGRPVPPDSEGVSAGASVAGGPEGTLTPSGLPVSPCECHWDQIRADGWCATCPLGAA